MSFRLSVYVTPKSGRDEIAGWRGGELYLKVTSPPEDGKANASACRLVAKALGLPKSAVSVVRGETSRHKQLQIESATGEDVHRVFGRPQTEL